MTYTTKGEPRNERGKIRSLFITLLLSTKVLYVLDKEHIYVEFLIFVYLKRVSCPVVW